MQEAESPSSSPVFYGWWIVAACFVIASIAWSLGLFGASVYLHAVSERRGWPIGLISTAITCFYLVSAFASPFVGTAMSELGPRAVVRIGALCLGLGVASIGLINQPWQVYLSFTTLGAGWALLSSTAISTMLAPWFEKHQGRAISTALMGASMGGILGVPLLMLGIDQLGLLRATLAAAATCLSVLLPLSFVLHRRPQEIGLVPDGAKSTSHADAVLQRVWTRAEAAKAWRFRSVALAFGIAFLVQVGFLTHHVSYMAPYLGNGGTSAVVSATAVAAFLGRMMLARYVDRLNPRVVACCVLGVGAAGLSVLSIAQSPFLIIAASLTYGLTVGNVTTLPSIIVRREFGSVSFGAVYGLAAMAIGLCSAIGPSFYGTLYELFGGYPVPMMLAAVLNVCAAAIIVWGDRAASTADMT
jgi:MFS family permease